MTGGRGGVGAWAAGGAAVVLTVVAFVALDGGDGGGPLGPRSDGRLGTSAMVALADELGADVTIADRLPELDEDDRPDVLVLFTDLLDADQRDAVDDWIDDGGRLVVTAPSSAYVPPVAGSFDGPGAIDPDRPSASRCAVDALDGIDVAGVEPYNGGVYYDVPGGADGCIEDGLGDAYVVARDRGRGTVVALGGSGMVVNAGLGDGENAAVVAALVAPEPGTGLVVLEPGTLVAGGEGDDTLSDLVSPGVVGALVQLALAFTVYALWRARRLGRPVPEPQPVALAGSELVAAVGTLLDRSRSPGHAGEVLRADLRRTLADRLGQPPTAPPELLARAVAERTRVPEETVLWALGTTPVADDAELCALAATIDRIREEVLDHV